jgi:hypothetical protein
MAEGVLMSGKVLLSRYDAVSGITNGPVINNRMNGET